MNTRVILIMLGLTALVGCSDGSDFSGSSPTKKQASSADQSQQKPSGDEDTLDQDGRLGGEDPGESSDHTPDQTTDDEVVVIGGDDPGDVPDNAVSLGSFTAWAEPSNPRPRENYWIHVEVRLPSNTKNYTVADLSGRLYGTDQYQRGIGRDSKGAVELGSLGGFGGLGNFGQSVPEDRFNLSSGRARISVWVPGAAYLVRDTISIRSDLLNESQSLTIVFQ